MAELDLAYQSECTWVRASLIQDNQNSYILIHHSIHLCFLLKSNHLVLCNLTGVVVGARFTVVLSIKETEENAIAYVIQINYSLILLYFTYPN